MLTRHLYRYGDQMLEEGTPIALSVNEMYSITKRLQLPFDASGTGRRLIHAHTWSNVKREIFTVFVDRSTATKIRTTKISM